MSIPIYINNRNRLTTTRKMVEYLASIPEAEAIIVDNASTYPPLLDWYAEWDGQVILLPENGGPWSPWKMGIDLAGSSSHYVVTDSDLDLSGVPIDMLDKLRGGLDRHSHFIKAALSLEVNDMPSEEIAAQVQAWEHTYWQRMLDGQWWIAPTDTTFAMYRRGWHRAAQCTAPAIRADRPYTARHIPWYRIMDEEEEYIEAHCEHEWSSTVKFFRQAQSITE